jgi:hypothetical protein
MHKSFVVVSIAPLGNRMRYLLPLERSSGGSVMIFIVKSGAQSGKNAGSDY